MIPLLKPDWLLMMMIWYSFSVNFLIASKLLDIGFHSSADFI